MRVKKQKRHRRAVRFYTVCFGFGEPFKVLCDGTFVHHLLVNHITPADTALANILGATVKLFTTRCVLAELKSLGKNYHESLNTANNLITARCDHEKRKSAVSCITDVIGENNPEHFFVATQDAELRRSLQKIKLAVIAVGGFCRRASGVAVAEEEIEEAPSEIDLLKKQLVDAFYGTNRGLSASSETRAEIVELITQLESKNPTPVPTDALPLLNGKWILGYTSFPGLLSSASSSHRGLLIPNHSPFKTLLSLLDLYLQLSFEVRSPKRVQIKFEEGVHPS